MKVKIETGEALDILEFLDSLVNVHTESGPDLDSALIRLYRVSEDARCLRDRIVYGDRGGR